MEQHWFCQIVRNLINGFACSNILLENGLVLWAFLNQSYTTEKKIEKAKMEILAFQTEKKNQYWGVSFYEIPGKNNNFKPYFMLVTVRQKTVILMIL